MIRVPQVRVVDEEGSQLGVMPTPQALAMAQERGFDLVEVAPMAAPPVVRFLDFGQFKYEATKREKEAKRKQRSVTFKEVRLKPKIATGDFDTRVRRAIQFLEEGDRLKVAVQFRGRELTHPEIGRNLLAKFSDRIKDHGVVERAPLLEGKSMHITVASTHKPKVIEAPKHGGGSSPTGTETPPPAPVSRGAAGATATPPAAPVEAATAPAVEAPATEPTAVEAPTTEPTPAATKPVAVKPATAASTKPVAVKPATAASTKPVAVKPVASTKPVEAKPAAAKPAAAKPAAAKPAAARRTKAGSATPAETPEAADHDSPASAPRPAAKRAPRATRATKPEAPAAATTGE
jgi:translation initiation factor IF-3